MLRKNYGWSFPQNHSHKEPKDSLRSLGAYVEKQAVLEPILLCRSSKCKQTKKPGY